jgi:hypothetical protein
MLPSVVAYAAVEPVSTRSSALLQHAGTRHVSVNNTWILLPGTFTCTRKATLQSKQEGENFGDRLQSTLGSCSVVFVGNNGRLNDAVADKFAAVAGYTPLKTSKILLAASGSTVEAIEKEFGRDHVVVTEISTLEQLGSMIRCSIGTMGDSWGATARYAALRLSLTDVPACPSTEIEQL